MHRLGLRVAATAGALFSVAAVGACSSGSAAAKRPTTFRPPCVPASAGQLARINASITHGRAVRAGVTVPIPGDAGFNALVAAKVSEHGSPIGVWELGSDRGVVAAVNKGAQDTNAYGTPNPGSFAAAQLREVTALPQYAALVACAHHQNEPSTTGS